MNLVVDIGNTRIKTALFAGKSLRLLKIKSTFSDLINDGELISQANHVIIGSVVDGSESLRDALHQKIPTLLFQSSTPIPLINLYQSANTLGSDRLAAAIGSYYLHSNHNILTIDAGTCIKYNFTNEQNEYLGGGISPGIQMRFKALHQFTSKVPFIDYDFTSIDLIGNNTQNSILSGVVNGCVAEIDGVISNYKRLFPNILVLLTGGDSEFLAKQLKNSIFAHQNLVLKGLNDILLYNLEHS